MEEHQSGILLMMLWSTLCPFATLHVSKSFFECEFAQNHWGWAGRGRFKQKEYSNKTGNGLEIFIHNQASAAEGR